LPVVASAALAFAAVVAILTVREVRIGARAMSDSDAALAHHDAPAALEAAHDAAEAYAPGNPYARAGFARLETIARDAEAHGDERTATAAWGAMRAAATATSGLFVSTESWRAMADDGVAHFSAHPNDVPAETRAPESVIRASLARDDVPSSVALLVLASGALAFFAGALRLAFAAHDLPALRREPFALAAAVGGLALYILACLRP
jgi:hypothetical protein